MAEEATEERTEPSDVDVDPDVDADESLPADDQPSGAPPTAGSRTAVIVASALAAVFFILAAVMTVVAAQASGDRRDADDARDDVAEVSGRLAEALLSYDHENLEATQAAVLALATGGFSTQVREDFPLIEETITSLQAQAVASVRGVYVGDVGDETASSVVVVDQVVTTNSGGERPQPTIYLQLDLVRLPAGWRVDSVINLNLTVLGDASANAGTSTSTTSTTAVPGG